METDSRLRIFISYSHHGNGPQWKAALIHALHVFEQHHLLDVWQDGKIRVSSYWDDDIKQAMSSASLAVLLLTKESLESEFILNTEFRFLRARQQHDRLPVLPVVCEPCDWRAHDWLRATQAPNNSKPLSKLSLPAQERVIRRLATDIAEELSRVALTKLPKPGQVLSSGRIYLDKFPLTRSAGLHEEKLIGREQELALLDLAFAQPHTAIVSLVAWGGVGKTMLVQHWLQRMQREGWFGAQRVCAWSFYSQGTKEDRQASEDTFLAHALTWFGVQCEPTLSPWDKGRLLADAVARERTLLVLDGIEPLQYPPGPMGGQLRAPGVQSLLKQLARKASADTSAAHTPDSAFNGGLCLVTTREPLTDLTDFQRRSDAAWGSVLRVNLGNLTEEAGAALLHHAGATRAGAAEIRPDDTELLAASREVDGHGLTLNLLGRFLARAHSGDICRRDLVKFEEADRKEQGGTTFKMLATFECWFAGEGEIEARSLTILRLLGLFDRPAESGSLAALRRSPIIPQLTEPLFKPGQEADGAFVEPAPLSNQAWNSAVSFLIDFGLITVQSEPHDAESLIDCHPLIREYFAKAVLSSTGDSWHSAQERLFRYQCSRPRDQSPDSLPAMAPLFVAVRHALLAGDVSNALSTIKTRIQREREFYATRRLGAGGELLACYAYAFSGNWATLSLPASSTDRAYVAQEAAFGLRSAGRLHEAFQLFLIASDEWRKAGRAVDQARSTANAAECAQITGDLSRASDMLDESVRIVSATKDSFNRMLMVAKRARIDHLRGRWADANKRFSEAITTGRRVDLSEEFQFFAGIRGYDYCEFALDILSHRSKEAATLRWPHPGIDYVGKAQAAGCRSEFLGILDLLDQLLSDAQKRSLRLDTGLLLLARARALRIAKIEGCETNLCDQAVSCLRLAGDLAYLPLGLVSRARLAVSENRSTAAIGDLEEAMDIAGRGPMRLHMADIHLERARLFCRAAPYPWESPQTDIAAAESLLHECNYRRRDEDLVDVKRAVHG